MLECFILQLWLFNFCFILVYSSPNGAVLAVMCSDILLPVPCKQKNAPIQQQLSTISEGLKVTQGILLHFPFWRRAGAH